MDPLLAWFAGQALGPELVAEATRILRRRDWQTAFAKEVADAVGGGVSWRSVRRWLKRPPTWPDLVQPSLDGTERLVADAEAILRRRRGRNGDDPGRRRRAEQVVGEAGARFLQSLDPSLAVAVAYHRAIREVAALGVRLGLPGGGARERLDELLRGSADRDIARVEALGVPGDLARQVAEALLCRPPAVAWTSQLAVITAELGSGKTTEAERHHRTAVVTAMAHSSAPLPVFVTARLLGGSLLDEVNRWWGDVPEIGRRGVHLVVDGLEEVGERRANDLVVEVHSALRRFPNSRALLTTRPLDVRADPGDRLSVPPLTDAEAMGIVGLIAGREVGQVEFHGWAPAAVDAVRRPLFAVAAGLALRHEIRPMSATELLAALARAATARMEWSSALEVLGRAAALSVDDGHGRVPVREAAETAEQRRVLASSTLVEVDSEDDTFIWGVVLLAEWFAAQRLLAVPALASELAVDADRLDRWRYAVLTAVQAAHSETVAALLDPIGRRAPAMAGWLLDRCRRPWRTEPPGLPVEEWGRRLRQATDALVEGLEGSAERVGPVREGRLLPLGVAFGAPGRLWYAWRESDPHGPAIGLLPADAAGERGSGWVGGRQRRLEGDPPWPWLAAFDDLRAELSRMLGEGMLMEGPAVLGMERDLKLALDLTGEDHLRTEAVALGRLEAVVADSADHHPGSTFQHAGRDAVRLGDVRELVARYRAAGSAEVTNPWPGPDRLGQGIGWVPHLWSPERLRDRAEGVIAAALEAYRTTVDASLPRFAAQLRVARMWPVRLVACLVPGTIEEGIPADDVQFVWGVEPSQALGVDIFIAHDLDDSLAMLRVLRGSNRDLPVSWGELPGLYGSTPCLDLATDLLWGDLRVWGWVTGSPRRGR